MLTTTEIKLICGGVLLLVFGSACAFFGWRTPHDALVKYRAEVGQAGAIQEAGAVAVETLHKKEMNDAKASSIQAIVSIDDYYKHHPAERVHNSCASGSSVPEALGSAEGPDGTASSGYASPYSPVDTEKVAARLYGLQELLRRDGVTVE